MTTELSHDNIAHEDQETEVKQRRSHVSSPIYGLPDEIMLDVLRYLHEQMISEPMEGYLPWLLNMQITRRIWSIASRAPVLWSTIRILRSKSEKDTRCARNQISLYNIRGASHPVTLMVEINDQSWKGSLPISYPGIDRVLPRVRTLSLHNPAQWTSLNEQSLYKILVTRSWEALEHLQITTELLSPYIPGTIDSGTISNHMLGGVSQTLTTLTLSGNWHLATFPRLPRLQHLKLDPFRIYDKYDKLQELLSKSLNLISVDLRFVVDTIPLSPMDETLKNSVSLPHLSALVIQGPSYLVKCALGMISDPHNSLNVMTFEGLNEGVDFESHLPAIICRVKTFLVRAQATQSEVPNTLVFTTQTQGPRAWIRLSPAAEVGADHLSKAKTVDYEGECELADLEQLVRLVAAIEFGHYVVYHEAALASMVLAGGVEHQLQFRSWTRLWLGQEEFIVQLENYLRERQEQGRQLNTLVVDYIGKKHDPDSLENRWLREGLVGQILEWPDEDTDVEESEEDQSPGPTVDAESSLH